MFFRCFLSVFFTSLLFYVRSMYISPQFFSLPFDWFVGRISFFYATEGWRRGKWGNVFISWIFLPCCRLYSFLFILMYENWLTHLCVCVCMCNIYLFSNNCLWLTIPILITNVEYWSTVVNSQTTSVYFWKVMNIKRVLSLRTENAAIIALVIIIIFVVCVVFFMILVSFKSPLCLVVK